MNRQARFWAMLSLAAMVALLVSLMPCPAFGDAAPETPPDSAAPDKTTSAPQPEKADPQPEKDVPADGDKARDAEKSAMAKARALYAQIKWTAGPAKVALGNKADLDVPAGYQFTGTAGAKLFAEVNQNPPDDSLLGVLMPQSDSFGSWFINFDYEDIGHVPDDEKNALTGDAANQMLATIRKNSEEGNIERSRRGWPALTIQGWEQSPFYDEQTHHMTWAIRVVSENQPTINYKSKLLSREGVMNAVLLASPEELKETVPVYNKLIGGISFRQGYRYEEFRSGDKIAKYGLIGLITGAGAVVAVKAWKGIVALGVMAASAFGAAVKKIKSFFTGRST